MELKLPPLPAASVSLNDIQDALAKGATPEEAVQAGLGKKVEKPAPAKKSASDEAPTKKTNG